MTLQQLIGMMLIAAANGDMAHYKKLELKLSKGDYKL